VFIKKKNSYKKKPIVTKLFEPLDTAEVNGERRTSGLANHLSNILSLSLLSFKNRRLTSPILQPSISPPSSVRAKTNPSSFDSSKHSILFQEFSHDNKSKEIHEITLREEYHDALLEDDREGIPINHYNQTIQQ